MNKKGFEFSFAWMFALIAGAFILFTAIYFAVNLISTQQYSGQTELAKEISIIFNPLETGLASGKATQIKLNQDTRIYNKCSTEGFFGREQFSLSESSGLLNKWPPAGGEISVYNKYVFSNETEQGNIFYFFSKPFEMPFKVSEMIFFSSRQFCFENAPEFIKEEVANLKLANIKIENCTGAEQRVCFNEGCDISVYPACEGSSCESEYDYGSIVRDGRRVYFVGSLLYAGIFSSPDIYECNFYRLMERTEQISSLYNDEAGFLVSNGCGNAMSSNLINLQQAAKNANPESLQSILELRLAGSNLDSQNSAAGGCAIY